MDDIKPENGSQTIRENQGAIGSFKRNLSIIDEDEKDEQLKEQDIDLEDRNNNDINDRNTQKFNTAEKIQSNYNSCEEGGAEKINQDFVYGGRKNIAKKVLTLGAGGDDQGHVTRPRTAQVNHGRRISNATRRANLKLETITENNKAEEEQVALSQQDNNIFNKFDIEASHSFSLRNFGKDKSSQQLIDTLKDNNADIAGRESSQSNYSKI